MITGECFCGAVQYAIDGELGYARMCHCSRCRKAFSGAGSAIAFLQPGQFRWLAGEANLTRYMNEDGYGRGFCTTCGTSICALHGEDVIAIMLGSLNGDPPVTIAEHIHVGSKACWDEIGGGAPQWPQNPPPDDPLTR